MTKKAKIEKEEAEVIITEKKDKSLDYVAMDRQLLLERLQNYEDCPYLDLSITAWIDTTEYGQDTRMHGLILDGWWWYGKATVSSDYVWHFVNTHTWGLILKLKSINVNIHKLVKLNREQRVDRESNKPANDKYDVSEFGVASNITSWLEDRALIAYKLTANSNRLQHCKLCNDGYVVVKMLESAGLYLVVENVSLV